MPGSEPALRTLVVGIMAAAGPAQCSLTPGTPEASQFKPAPSPHPTRGTVDHAPSLPSPVWDPQACPQWLHPAWSSMASHGLVPGGHAAHPLASTHEGLATARPRCGQGLPEGHQTGRDKARPAGRWDRAVEVACSLLFAFGSQPGSQRRVSASSGACTSPFFLRDLRTLQLLHFGLGLPHGRLQLPIQSARSPAQPLCPRPLWWTPPFTLSLVLRAPCAQRIPRPKLRAQLAPEPRPLGRWKYGLSAPDAEKLPATPAGRADALGGAKPRGLDITTRGQAQPAAPRPPLSPSSPGPRKGEVGRLAPATGHSACLVISSGSSARPFLGSGAKQPGALSPRCREAPALLLNFCWEQASRLGTRACPLAAAQPVLQLVAARARSPLPESPRGSSHPRGALSTLQ
ncbi:hypothetical protein MC885_002790 [Smutsia gigantea]|nr:hypothetical protein MC885_002790 [Smutsia gigantea]